MEDLILHSALRNVDKGFYIDVGANDSTAISVTRFFYERGKLQLYGGGTAATFSDEVAKKGEYPKTIEVDVVTLSDIQEQYPPPSSRNAEIHFCKIDVEGFEKEVLEGIKDWDKFRPWIFVVEATEPGTSIPCHEKWEYILLEHGYNLALNTGLNRYYLDIRKQHLQAYFADTKNFLKQHEVIKLNMQQIKIN